MTILTVDRIEGNFFVCYDESEKKYDIPTEKIKNAKPGDVVVEENGKFSVSQELTGKFREQTDSLQKNLWE